MLNSLLSSFMSSSSSISLMKIVTVISSILRSSDLVKLFLSSILKETSDSGEASCLILSPSLRFLSDLESTVTSKSVIRSFGTAETRDIEIKSRIVQGISFLMFITKINKKII